MNDAVSHLYGIVEASEDCLTIPPRPVADQSDVQFYQMPNRLWTYRVTAGGSDAARTIGYVRWDENDVWIARTPGNERMASAIKRFATHCKATEWLQRRRRGE